MTKLDRLARSTQHLLETLDRVKSKGGDLHILNLGADSASPTGKLIYTVVGAVAAFERELMLERQRERIAKGETSRPVQGSETDRTRTGRRNQGIEGRWGAPRGHRSAARCWASEYISHSGSMCSVSGSTTGPPSEVAESVAVPGSAIGLLACYRSLI